MSVENNKEGGLEEIAGSKGGFFSRAKDRAITIAAAFIIVGGVGGLGYGSIIVPHFFTHKENYAEAIREANNSNNSPEMRKICLEYAQREKHRAYSFEALIPRIAESEPKPYEVVQIARKTSGK